MKKAFLSLTVLALAAAVFAQAKSKPAPIPANKQKIHCAVMKASWVNIADATKSKMFADFNGRRYFFCCGGCPEAFAKDPKKYAKNDSIPTPKAKIKKPLKAKMSGAG